jgi:hypothetical protein
MAGGKKDSNLLAKRKKTQLILPDLLKREVTKNIG